MLPTIKMLVFNAANQPVNRIVVSPDSGWTPPAGHYLAPDDGRPLLGAPPNTLIPSIDFLGRFTDAEQGAIAAKAITVAPGLLVGMTRMSAATNIDLNDPQVAAYLAAAVAVGALTAARAAVIGAP